MKFLDLLKINAERMLEIRVSSNFLNGYSVLVLQTVNNNLISLQHINTSLTADIWYRDQQFGTDMEYISLGVDNQTLFSGFHRNFIQFIESVL